MSNLDDIRWREPVHGTINSRRWTLWYAVMDWRTCDGCRSLNERIVDGEEIVRAHAGHTNCRCYDIEIKAIRAERATALGENGADWFLKHRGRLPDYYTSKKDAEALGWEKTEGNLAEVLPGKMIWGDVYWNDNGVLPRKAGRVWYEADISYTKGKRNAQRVVYSNDGLIFATYDHLKTFFEITK